MSDPLNDIFGGEHDKSLLADTARTLLRGRPVPRPGFRGELGRLLRVIPVVKPIRHLRLKAICLATCGALLLGAAGTGVAGSGPLAPGHSVAP